MILKIENIILLNYWDKRFQARPTISDICRNISDMELSSNMNKSSFLNEFYNCNKHLNNQWYNWDFISLTNEQPQIFHWL